MVPEDKKRQLVKEILEGRKTQVEAAREVDLSRQAISLWVKEYKKRGESAFRARRGRPKIKPLPRETRERLGTLVRTLTPVEAGLDRSLKNWTYEAVRQLIIRETGVKLTYRFAAQYLEEWGMPRPRPMPAKNMPKSVSSAAPPTIPDEKNVDTEFSLSEYEAAVAESRSKLNPPRNPVHGHRTGRHARGKSAPMNKKKRKRGRGGKRR